MNFLLKPITDRLATLFPGLWVDRWHGQVEVGGYEYALPACFVETVRFRYLPGDRLGNHYTALLRFHVRQEQVYEAQAGEVLETESLLAYHLPERIEQAFNGWELPERFRMEILAPAFSGNRPESEWQLDFNVWGWRESGLELNTLRLSSGLGLQPAGEFKAALPPVEGSASFPIATADAWRVWVILAIEQNGYVHGVQATVLKSAAGFEASFTTEELHDGLVAEFEVSTQQNSLMLTVHTTATGIRYETLHIL